MTDEKKRLYMDLMAATNQLVMDIVCPPGALALLFLTWAVGIPGLIFLFWVLYR